MIKGGRLSTQPDIIVEGKLEIEGHFIFTIGKKRYKCHSLRGCFKAANGRWPKDLKELDKFIDKVVYG